MYVLMSALFAALLTLAAPAKALPSPAAAPSGTTASSSAPTVAPSSSLWPKAKKVSSECAKSKKWPSTARHTLLKKGTGSKKASAKACLHAAQDAYYVDLTKVYVELGKAYTSKVKIRIRLSDESGQWVDWRGTITAGNGWYKVGLPVIPAHPLSHVVALTELTLTKKAGGTVTFYQQKKVYNTGFKAGIR